MGDKFGDTIPIPLKAAEAATDVPPDSVAPMVAGMMEQGLEVAQGVLGRVPA